MELYTCAHCHNPVYFENNICLTCSHALGFDASRSSMVTLDLNGGIFYKDIKNNIINYKYCQNSVYSTCNWLIPGNSPEQFCIACSLNRTIPSLIQQENLKSWSKIELAKHRLIYSLLRLELPVQAKINDEKEGIAFDFLQNASSTERVVTGHAEGVVTINIEEANEAQRVRHKLDLGEKYRTLLGHLRHEIGHYYWDVLIRDTNKLEPFRKLFGDDRKDYGAALEIYYGSAPPNNWNDNFISLYSTAHAWEDWAETWSHYLHLMDTLETAYAFGTTIKPKELKDQEEMQAAIRKNPYSIKDFNVIFKMWLPLMFALNSINRSMGHEDFYPFVISPRVVEKLAFIHNVCAERRSN